MFVKVINIGLSQSLDHAVVVRTNEPDEFVSWVRKACPEHSNLRRLNSIDERFPDLKYCVRVDLTDRDLMMFKLRWH